MYKATVQSTLEKKVKKPQLQRKTITVDAQDQPLGRLAVQVAVLLRGKNKATYLPYKDVGDTVLVKNIDKMKFTPSKLNTFVFFKLPSAFWSGVRVKSITEVKCEATVKYRWFNQNPFNSMYFAVQAMAAELSTGALVMYQIKKSNKKISMLVANNKANFTKKATGKITFTCLDGDKIESAINQTIATGEGQTFWMKSIGVDETGAQVSEMDFEWSIKIK